MVWPSSDVLNLGRKQNIAGHNAQEGTLSEKISRYVDIHRKNRFDVRIQEMVSKVQFSGPI